MKPTSLTQIVLLPIVLLAGCKSGQIPVTLVPQTAPEALSPTQTATNTPDSCTGWTCDINGVVYIQAAQPGNELEGISLTLLHSSHCSPTRGEHITLSDHNGAFTFGQLFFHDTDRVQIRIDVVDTASTVWDSQGRYCFYCSCFGEPLEIVLPPTTEIE